MSANSSSSTNASFPSSSLSSFVSVYYQLFNCFSYSTGNFHTTTFVIVSVLLLLPLCVLVLYLGLQRWRQQRSDTTTSHSDLITYHMVLTELVSISGSTLICVGVHTGLPQMTMVGVYLVFVKLSGQMIFHIVACVERYLAVVHPVTYLSLKKAKGTRMRNITIGCAWLLCFALTGSFFARGKDSIILPFFIMSFVLIVVSFCSLSVLCVLIRPGPGEGGGDRQRVDQSKLRAFYTIMAILGVLLFRFGGNIVATALFMSLQLGEAERCDVWLSVIWFSLPSSLVLPLLFLLRAGKLLCYKNNKASGPGSD